MDTLRFPEFSTSSVALKFITRTMFDQRLDPNLIQIAI